MMKDWNVFARTRPRRLSRYIEPLNELTTAARTLYHARRRSGWFLDNLSPLKLLNMLGAGLQYALKMERMAAWPIALKIDISPICNLSCTICVHADPENNPRLLAQDFRGGQVMHVEDFRRIVNQVKGRTAAVSLYYLGDPLMHPRLATLCRIAREANLNVHVSTNYSLRLSDARIRELLTCGLTHLSVCVDGMSQESYQKTRVGGRLDLVLDNLRRTCELRRELKLSFPKIEVQYIKFQHNVHEVEAAETFCNQLGVDQFASYWGSLNNYTDVDPGTYAVHGPKRNRLLPQCLWPHFFMLIKYDGGVIPCCNYRHGSQYAPQQAAEARVLANVFESSVRDIWNSADYRLLRRLVSHPAKVAGAPGAESSFCQGCPQIYETDSAANRKHAAEWSYEAVFEQAGSSRPRRLPVVQARSAQG